MNFTDELKCLSSMVDRYLDEYFDGMEQDVPEKNLLNSMRYSLMAGGKRIRPVLALAVAKMLGEQVRIVMPFAASIEMIHTYSLIHDDLPAMDDDDYRRGKLTNHKVYGEAMAILAGDALLNEALNLMLKASLSDPAKMKQMVEATLVIAEAAGKTGMIAGQVIDMEAEGKTLSAGELKNMHRKKTGALLKASILAPAIISGSHDKILESLSQYADSIGLAFQIKDDILDVESSLTELGKPAGSDAKNDKNTYVTLYGIEQAKSMLNEATENAVDALKLHGERAWFLRETAYFIANRKH